MKKRYIVLLIGLLSLVALVFAGSVTAGPPWTYYYSSNPTGFTCDTTTFSATGATLTWDLPVNTSNLVITANEYINGAFNYTYNGNNQGGGAGSAQTSIFAQGAFPTQNYPYTWSREFTVTNNGQCSSVSIIEIECTGSTTATVIRNEVDTSCGSGGGTGTGTTAVPVPGCDALLRIPETAVMGRFVDNAATYWMPGEMVSPPVVIEVGKTAWVLGIDESGQYYKILWSCEQVWVPVETMGPNYDDVWNCTPLPTGVVG